MLCPIGTLQAQMALGGGTFEGAARTTRCRRPNVAYFDFHSLIHVQLHNDQLNTFLNGWECVLVAMHKWSSADICESLFYT